MLYALIKGSQDQVKKQDPAVLAQLLTLREAGGTSMLVHCNQYKSNSLGWADLGAATPSKAHLNS